MNKRECVQAIVPHLIPAKQSASAFAPTNIALVKYWGKRDQELNLPMTSSLSLSLSSGTHTTLRLNEKQDTISYTGFAERIFSYLDLFRPKGLYFEVETKNDLPTAAGLATSASGYAALVLALNELFDWNLDAKSLSILARLGSGSSARSLYSGFVEWHRGMRADGMDSYAEPFQADFSGLCMGVWLISKEEKPLDSRRAMQQTLDTSFLYRAWSEQVAHNMTTVKKALLERNFSLLGRTCEQNALSMHATMLSASPSICYFLPETIQVLHAIWKLRHEGLEVYATMDAGPNVKVLFHNKDRDAVLAAIPQLLLLSHSQPKMDYTTKMSAILGIMYTPTSQKTER